jgi:cardiolipin synthase
MPEITWLLMGQVGYFILLLLVVLRVLYDTRSSTKTLAYVLFIILVPVVGMIFYFSFGVNYRKRKLYSKKIIKNKELRRQLHDKLHGYSERVTSSDLLPPAFKKLARLIEGANESPLMSGNKVELLINGEEKFPALLAALKEARHHIHLEYYIFEDDVTGNAIADVLIERAQAGVAVRFLYDDFGSHSLSSRFIDRLQQGRVLTAPFYEIKFWAFANRLNYRNHRKIIVIDGRKAFVGGINISDRYRNDVAENDVFWRDTHLLIEGRAAFYLQYLFLGDWNFCNDLKLDYGEDFFPEDSYQGRIESELVQIVASGPDSDLPVILYSLVEAIGAAEKRLLITTPYFIPGESLVDLLVIAAKSGIEVKLLVPGISDSKIVNVAARSHYSDLLRYGVRIFEYQKGFVHAKTIVVDDTLALVGSSNMDYRSFDLNFEVNALVYSKAIAGRLAAAFEEDLLGSKEIDRKKWLSRPKYALIWEKVVRLLSPFM